MTGFDDFVKVRMVISFNCLEKRLADYLVKYDSTICSGIPELLDEA